MKSLSIRRPVHGFTLIELLVVIAIIAVLAAMGFAGAQAAIKKARKTKARKICVTLDQAVMAFYDEYGHLPTNPEGKDPIKTDDEQGARLVTILLGYETGDEVENLKAVRFFDAPEAKNRRDGIMYSGNSNNVEALYDPWGEPYQILLDHDYDESIDDPFSSSQNAKLRGRRVGTFTYGNNGKNDEGGKDDVKSW